MTLPVAGAAVLSLRARRSGASPQWSGDRYLLQGELEWIVEGDAAPLAAIVAALPEVAEPLGSVVLLTFGNAIGFFTLPGIGRVEVVSGKWTIDHFNRMLATLTAIASGLPFGTGSPTALPYDRSIVAQRDVLYHMFIYLRHVLSESLPPDRQLLPALRVVLRQPHQRRERRRQVVPIERLRRLDVAGVVRLVGGDSPLTPVDGRMQRRLPLARALGGALPQQVEEEQIITSHDTDENRFVKAFIGLALGLIEQMRTEATTMRGQGRLTQRLVADCNAMESLLRPIERHPLWREVSAMVHLPASSTVLQRQRGYRELYGHFARLRLATRLPLTPTLMHALLDAKDIATLYELWCFFTLVEALQERCGPPLHAQGVEYDAWQVRVPWDLAVRWADGIEVLYNPRFSRARGEGRRSYSVPLRPDIAVCVPTGYLNAGLHLFDAKFRLDRLDSVLPLEGSDERDDEAGEEQRGVFKRGDLYKMHAYRDAIPGARSVWILYPGTELRYFASDSLGPIVTEAAAYPAQFDGVGAIPLQPDATLHRGLAALCDRLLRDESNQTEHSRGAVATC